MNKKKHVTHPPKKDMPNSIRFFEQDSIIMKITDLPYNFYKFMSVALN